MGFNNLILTNSCGMCRGPPLSSFELYLHSSALNLRLCVCVQIIVICIHSCSLMLIFVHLCSIYVHLRSGYVYLRSNLRSTKHANT